MSLIIPFFLIRLFFPAPVHFLAAVTLFLEFWKRYQAKLEYEWDTVEFLEQEEPPRPEYEAKCIYDRKNPITGVNYTLTQAFFLLAANVLFHSDTI